MIVKAVFTPRDRAPAVKLSGGPSTPPEAEAPGLGAPPGPSPPPLMLAVAVGRGDAGVLDEDVAFPLDVPFPELDELEALVFEAGEAERVSVTTLEMTCVVC